MVQAVQTSSVSSADASSQSTQLVELAKAIRFFRKDLRSRLLGLRIPSCPSVSPVVSRVVLGFTVNA